MPSLDRHIFNDDLLANENDLEKIRALYPTMEHVLHHPDLIDYFKHYNELADAAKATSRKYGTSAIILSAVAIALAGIEIASWQLSPNTWPLVIGGFAAFCGIASVIIGALGALFGTRKRAWLHNRFMGERIRQFHFQSLIARLPQIIESLQDGNRKDLQDHFKENRRGIFLSFRHQFEGRIDSKFNDVISPDGHDDWWLPARQPGSAVPDTRPELEPLFKAYRDLRIEHQIGYANYRLQTEPAIFSSMPVRQAQVLETVSKYVFVGLVVTHLIVLGVIGFELTLALRHAEGASAVSVTILFSIAIIIVAVIALAARAFEQGLQPEREIERYQQYRSAVRSIRDQYDAAETPRQKIAVMRHMEQVAFEEMRNFLITNDRSSFTI